MAEQPNDAALAALQTLIQSGHEDVREIRSLVTDLVKATSATNQKVDNLVARLYSDGGGGAIPALFKRDDSIEAKVGALTTQVSNQKAYALGVAACGTVLLHVLKGVINKTFGVNIP